MEMKELNKQQLILLAILISFITSIATGIVTVTLLQQAPTSFTTPMNRVVRQTVEKIVPGEVTNTTQTVVVKEEDLIVDAIAKNQSAVFSIFKQGSDDTGKTIEVSAGRGFVISNNDTIVADASLVPDKEIYFVKNDSGKFKADFISSDANGFTFLKIGAPVDDKSKLVYTLPAFGDISKMKAGQKIIVMGNTISSFIYDGSKELKLSVSKALAGGIVLDLDGNVLGVALSGDNSFSSIEDIMNVLNPKKETPKAVQN